MVDPSPPVATPRKIPPVPTYVKPFNFSFTGLPADCDAKLGADDSVPKPVKDLLLVALSAFAKRNPGKECTVSALGQLDDNMDTVATHSTVSINVA